MAYIRPPSTVLAGRGLKQTPDSNNLDPAGVLTVLIDADIASDIVPGIVQIGNNINVSPSGVISVDDPIAGPTGPAGPTGGIGPTGPTGPTGSGSSITGSWIPTLISGPGGGTITVSNNGAEYVKNGKFVFLTFDITVSALASGSSSSVFMLEGLPFLSNMSGVHSGSVIVSYFGSTDSPMTLITGAVISNSFACDLWKAKANVTTLPLIERGDIKVSTRLVGTISYISAS